MNEQLLLRKITERISKYTDFKGMNNEKIRVLSLGNYSPSNGPDFQNSVLEVDGRIQRGDIEVDVNASGWLKHGHCQDPDFNNVILQMFFHDDRPGSRTETMDSKRIFKVKVDDFDLKGDSPDNGALTLKKKDFYRFLPCNEAFSRSKPDIHAVIQSILKLGMRRFLRKTVRFKAWAAPMNDPTAAFLKLLFIFLAGPANRTRFSSIADKPWFAESLKLRDSGLFRTFLDSEIPSTARLWNRTCVRPFGSPERRLKLFISLIRNPAVFELPRIIEETWLRHSGDARLLQKAFSDRLCDVGLAAGSARLAVANLLLPYLFIRLPAERRRILSTFRMLEGAENNSKIERFSDWPVPDPIRRSEAFQQGILGLHETYCSGRCPRCPVFTATGNFFIRFIHPFRFFSSLWKRTA